MAAYRRVYDSPHLQADCQEPDQLRDPTLGNRVWATFTFFNDMLPFIPLHFLCTHFWHLVHCNELLPTPLLQTPHGHLAPRWLKYMKNAFCHAMTQQTAMDMLCVTDKRCLYNCINTKLQLQTSRLHAILWPAVYFLKVTPSSDDFRSPNIDFFHSVRTVFCTSEMPLLPKIQECWHGHSKCRENYTKHNKSWQKTNKRLARSTVMWNTRRVSSFLTAHQHCISSHSVTKSD